MYPKHYFFSRENYAFYSFIIALMGDYFEEFRLNMKYYRDERKLSQSELAVLADCSNGLIGNIEAGKVHPSFETITAIAAALKVHPADLFLRNSSSSSEKIKNYIKNCLYSEIDRILTTRFPK